MTKYINNCIHDLEMILKGCCQKVEIVIVEDERGIGKTTFVETYFETKNEKDTLFFKSGICQITLNDLYQQMLNYGLGTQYNERVSQIQFSSFVLQNLIDFALTDRKYICFDGLDLYDNESMNFFFDFLAYLINKKYDRDNDTVIFVLIDGKLNNKNKSFMNSFGRYIQYFKMPSWTRYDFEDLLEVNYCKLQMPTESIELINKYSFGNVGTFLSAMDYLKIKKVIYKKDSMWKCDAFPETILLSNFQSSISERFDLLDEALKIVLKKASVVGLEFSFCVLEKPLHVQLANKALNEIETISRLIDEKIDAYNVYQFKSIETQASIESLVEPENTQIWSNLLGDHYISEVNDAYKSDMLFICERLLRASLYYKKGERFEKAFSCCIHLIPLLISQFRFYQALDVIGIAESIGVRDDNLKACLFKFKYISSIGVFDFDEAYTAINKYALIVKPQHFEEIHINALRAYVLYNKGLTRKAYLLAKSNYETLKRSYYPKGDHTDTLSLFEKKTVVNSIAILAALEQTLGIQGFVKHFNIALSYAKDYKLNYEYYSLLRRCTLAHRDQAAVTLLCEAKNFFVSQNQIEYAMSCYNLATEYVYLNMPNEASENIKIANDIFLQMNHAGIVLVQIEKAILLSIYDGQYDLALEIMKNRCVRYDEDFVELVYNFNMATLYRKFGMLKESWECISITEQINKKNENELPYFEKLILAQKGYLKLSDGDIEGAASYFENFLKHSYEVKYEIMLSVAHKYAEINAEKVVPEDIRQMATSENPVAKVLFKKQLVFAELSFWEL